MMYLPLSMLLVCISLVNGLDDFEKRKRFHDRQCQLTPSLPSCSTPYTLAVFKRETTTQSNSSHLQKSSKAMGVKRTVRRSSWYDDDDEDYEFQLWKKYRREKLRRRLLQNSGDSSESVQYHYHNYNSPYSNGYRSYPYTGYYRPSYYGQQYGYPYNGYGYGGGYPSYGSGYGGYGGGLGGGLFSLGAGRQFGISTPIGGFGYSSGFGIGIG